MLFIHVHVIQIQLACTFYTCTLGCAIPRESNSSGCFTGNSMTSLISLICLSSPPIMSYVESGTFSTIIRLTRGSIYTQYGNRAVIHTHYNYNATFI